MQAKISEVADRIIWISYLALVIITPLLFTTSNTELFEVPKMIFVYAAATVIFFLTGVKFVLERKIVIPKSWPLAALVIFVAIQIASTVTSIDKFTSIFGYPSRLNGGLLSQFAYLAIFASSLINLDTDRVKKLLVATVITAFAVSLWGVSGHFGRDPTCFVLTGKITADCWQKEFDPTVRIFATLGQPNWLASYLVLVLPISIALILISKNSSPKVFFAVCSLILFWATVLTNSRAGVIGAIFSLAIFGALLGTKLAKSNWKILIPLSAVLAIIVLIFGTALFSRIGEGIRGNQQEGPKSALPTESGQIRLIVWRGALEVFKNYPLLGTGPETFAYSYYLFRPTAHNQTTEWNFFYNKAHNEFLNYAANTGVLGVTAYTLFILIALITINRQQKTDNRLLAKAVIAAVAGYQTTIFFGFSVVATQVAMFVIIASTLILQRTQNLRTIKLNFPSQTQQKVAAGAILIAGAWTLIFIGRMYFADFYLAQAKNQEGPSNLISYAAANQITPTANPFYLADYSHALAQSAATVNDRQIALTLARQTAETAQKSQKISSNNLITARKIANAYFLIADFDPKYRQQALTVGAKLTQLAPTDPQSYLTLAQIQAGLGQKDGALQTARKAFELRPNYDEAGELIKQLTVDN